MIGQECQSTDAVRESKCSVIVSINVGVYHLRVCAVVIEIIMRCSCYRDYHEMYWWVIKCTKIVNLVCNFSRGFLRLHSNKGYCIIIIMYYNIGCAKKNVPGMF